ncbi:hypothetical protein BP6252_02535 [Coleophoma cylindrospora]|uniref:Uncharacterized protein n=1 Tax=Coleophoma cylindrospora TaxID=1849047 RepID=A0A3D8SF26_9HELO|nr:hypothetical protein BP6252_02535 [Coleophoma cylindrospora]
MARTYSTERSLGVFLSFEVNSQMARYNAAAVVWTLDSATNRKQTSRLGIDRESQKSAVPSTIDSYTLVCLPGKVRMEALAAGRPMRGQVPGLTRKFVPTAWMRRSGGDLLVFKRKPVTASSPRSLINGPFSRRLQMIKSF